MSTDSYPSSSPQTDENTDASTSGTPDDSDRLESDSEPKSKIKRLSDEAARYRTERNAIQAERDELAQRVETLLRREAERVAASHLAEPADLFTLSGKTLRDFVGEDGELDTDAVKAAVDDLLGSRPRLSRNDRAIDHSQGSGLGQVSKPKPSWEALFQRH